MDLPSGAKTNNHPLNNANSNEVPEGINLRKEAQKIDLKQFDSSDVEHVIPIISVMRPPTGFRDQLGSITGPNTSTNPPTNQTSIQQQKGGEKDNVAEDNPAPVTVESKQLKAEKEANKMIHRYNRAWKRLRPELDLPSSDSKPSKYVTSLNTEESTEHKRNTSSSALPALYSNKRPVTQSLAQASHGRSMTTSNRNGVGVQGIFQQGSANNNNSTTTRNHHAAGTSNDSITNT